MVKVISHYIIMALELVHRSHTFIWLNHIIIIHSKNCLEKCLSKDTCTSVWNIKNHIIKDFNSMLQLVDISFRQFTSFNLFLYKPKVQSFKTYAKFIFGDFLPIVLWNSKITTIIYSQSRPWSDGSNRSPLIRVWSVWKYNIDSL